jgi:DNA-binding MarR family transcriptional regulator
VAEQVGVAAGLVRLSFLVQLVYGEVCDEQDLTPPQAQLLCVLRDAPRGMAELAQTLRLEKSSVTGLVDRAERRGLVCRVSSTADRRAVTVELTPAGETLASTFHHAVSERLNETVAGLTQRDRTRLAAIASDVLETAQVPAVFADESAG